MKKILSLAIAVLATAGLTLQAAQVQSKVRQDNGEKVTKHAAVDKKKCAAKHFNPFEGINLTDQQKEQLKALRPQKGDKQAFDKQKADRVKVTPEQRKQAAADRLAKIKTILTPEQYQQYLENVAVSKMNQDHKKCHKGGKHDRRGQERKGHRGEHKQPQAETK